MKPPVKRKGVIAWFTRLVSRTVRFLLKLGARTVGALLLFILIGAFAVYLTLRGMLDSDGVRSMLVERIQESLHRSAQIESVILTPGGIRLKGVRIIERLDIPGHAALDSDFAHVTIKLLPLAYGQVRLKNVVLVAPRISIVRTESGDWSVSDIFKIERPAPQGFHPFSVLATLGADRIRIEDGLIKIDDRMTGRKVIIEKFDLELEDFDFTRPFGFSFSFDNVNKLGGQDVSTSWEARGKVNMASFDWSKAQGVASHIRVSLDGYEISGSVGAKNFDDPELDLSLKLPEWKRSRWLKYFKEAPDFAMPASRWEGRLTLNLPEKVLVRKLSFDAGPLSASYSGAIQLQPPGPVFAGEWAVKQFPMAQASLLTGFFRPFRLAGTLDGKAAFTAGPGKFLLHRCDLRLRRGLGRYKGYDFGGDIDLTVHDDLRRAHAVVRGGSLGAFSDSFTGIDLKGELDGKRLRIEDMAFGWGDSRMKLKLMVEDYSRPKEIRLIGSLDRLHWERARRLIESLGVLKKEKEEKKGKKEASRDEEKDWVDKLKVAIPKKFPDTIGKLRIGEIVHEDFSIRNFDILWDLGGVSPSLKYIKGEAKFGFGPGRVADIPAVQKASQFIQIVFIPFVYMHKMNKLSVFSMGTAYPKTLDFNRIEGEYGFRRGVVSTRYFHVDSPQLVAYTDGSMDFGKKEVDMDIITRLTEYRGQLPQWWHDENGRPAIRFRVKGDLGHPDLDPSLKQMPADMIEKKLEAGLNKSKKHFKAEEKLKSL